MSAGMLSPEVSFLTRHGVFICYSVSFWKGLVLVCLGCHTAYHGWLSGLKPQKFIPHSPVGWGSELRVPAGLGSGGRALPGLPVATFSGCPCVVDREKEEALWRLFLGGHGSHHEGPVFLTSSNPSDLPKSLRPNSIPRGVRASTYKLGDTVHP